VSDLRKVKSVFLIVLLTAACTMPSTKIYSLYLPEGEKTPQKTSGIFLVLRVTSVRYLAQPYIAYRTSPYQLDLSGYAKWDASPSEMVRDAFRRSFEASGQMREVQVSHFPSEGSYALDIYVRRFERLDAEGGPYADLAFDARLSSPGGKEMYRGEISRRMRLQDRSFLSLAKALSTGLLESMEEVKGQVAKVIAAAGDSSGPP
jgi:uncharacterized lipoprotein YmbA